MRRATMSELKKVYVADGPGDAHLLCGLLEVVGIAAVIRGDDMVPLQGGSLFAIETRPSVWVLSNDAEADQYARAVEIAKDYAARKRVSDSSTGEPWHCGSCGEIVESQFTECWKCGVTRG